MLKTNTRTLAMGMLAVLMVASAQVTVAEPTEVQQDWQFVDFWFDPIPPFEEEGPIVEGADAVGGTTFGVVGTIIGIPIGVVAAPVGQIVASDPEAAFDQGLEKTATGFSAVGKYILGLPTFLVKKTLWDFPIWAYRGSTGMIRNTFENESLPDES